MSFDGCLLCAGAVDASFEKGGVSFLVPRGTSLTRFEESRGGTIIRPLTVWGLLSIFNFLSVFPDTERTLAVRRCASFVIPSYLSFRTCSELVLVGLGEGIPVTDSGRGFARVSRIEG